MSKKSPTREGKSRMNYPFVEKREFDRLVFQKPVKVVLGMLSPKGRFRQDKNPPIDAWTNDINETGLQIETHRAFEPGSLLKMMLEIEENQPVELYGKIVWSHNNHSGVHFLMLNKELPKFHKMLFFKKNLCRAENAERPQTGFHEFSTMRKKPPTMMDVADLVGVSLTTVSMVINNDPRIGEITRRWVLEAVEILEFRVNEKARALSLRKKEKRWAVVDPSGSSAAPAGGPTPVRVPTPAFKSSCVEV